MVFVLKRNSANVNPGEKSGCVVRADHEAQARAVAGRACGVEGDGAWTDPERCSCLAIGEGEPAVLQTTYGR